MQKAFPIFIMALILISCSSQDTGGSASGGKNNAAGLWEAAAQYRENEDIDRTVTTLMQITRDFGTSAEAVKAQFQIAEVFLNDVRDYELAIVHFRKVIQQYGDDEMAVKALFMIGYIQANYLQAYTDAVNNYHTFLQKYPDHELVPSVEYELESLSDIQAEIDSLNDLAE